MGFGKRAQTAFALIVPYSVKTAKKNVYVYTIGGSRRELSSRRVVCVALLMQRALAVEVDEFLGRPRYERRVLAEHGYRNGYGRPRAVAIGTWPVEVRAPRIRDLPDDAPPFHSAILPRRRIAVGRDPAPVRLYLEGLSSGDFEPAFRELLGEVGQALLRSLRPRRRISHGR